MPRDGRPPYFPFYPDDFVSDGDVEAMRTEEVGAYILLLCKAWREDPPCSIPNDDRLLAKWSRLTDQAWLEARPAVLACWDLRRDGRLYQKRLRLEYEKLRTRHRLLSQQGRIGAAKKWLGQGGAIAGPSPGHKPGYSKSSSSSIKSPLTPLQKGGRRKRSNGLYVGGNPDIPPQTCTAQEHLERLRRESPEYAKVFEREMAKAAGKKKP